MPSVNLIWEQRLARRKNQRLATLLLAVIGVGVLIMLEEAARTTIKRSQCQAAIRGCEDRIKKAKPDADRNRDLRSQIAGLEPKVALVTEAQRITLRWVSLLGELDGAVPDTRQVYFSQCSFSAGASGPGKKADAGLIGSLSLSGAAQSFDQVAETMRRLTAQRHVSSVRLGQAQALQDEGVRFALRAQFCIPDDEEIAMAVAEESTPKGGDLTGVVQKAGKDTVLNRTSTLEKVAQ